MAKQEFNNFIHDTGLINIPFDGPKLSWCNGRQGIRRIWVQLDHILLDQNFKNKFPSASMSYLDRTSSEHCLMVLHCRDNSSLQFPRPFRFLRMWCSHKGFLPLVKQIWEMKVTGSPMVCLGRKLQTLNKVSKSWNREVFGRVQQEIGFLEDKLTHLENSLIDKFSLEIENQLLQCWNQYAV